MGPVYDEHNKRGTSIAHEPDLRNWGAMAARAVERSPVRCCCLPCGLLGQ
jgi:hypothetical protein